MAKETKKIKEKLFGTDGVRGRANHHPMTVENTLLLGKAIARMLQGKGGRQKVVIGKDTRLSCYMFENALIAGLCSMGVDTLMVGPLPTPGVAFITRAYRANAGIVISASHNPYFDNGIKIFSSDGFKLDDAVENKIESLIEANEFNAFLPADNDVGRNKRIADADGRYIEFLKATFPRGKNLKGFKIFLDCAHGAAHRVAPLVFSELDADVVVVGNEPDGLNINRGVGALYPQVTRKGVLEKKCDVGIALDGDGDRVIMIDEEGSLVDGDVLLAIAAADRKEKNLLINNRVVATVMTNFGVLQYLHSLEIEVLLSKVGDRYVIQEMLSRKASLGGEQSGHLIFLEHNTTGDGLVTALQVLKIMLEKRMTLSKLAKGVNKCPQILLNVPVVKKTPLESLKKVKEIIQLTEEKLAKRGRVLVRYSGTEHLCRVMVEGPKRSEVKSFAEGIAAAINHEIGVKK
jgi:phosphoglucosamine mutase